MFENSSSSALVKYIVYMLIRSSLLTCSVTSLLIFFFLSACPIADWKRCVNIDNSYGFIHFCFLLFVFALRQWDVHRFTILSSWWMNFLLLQNFSFKKENLKIYFLWNSLQTLLVSVCLLFFFFLNYSVSLYLTCISFIWNICAYF